jgi:hypothetical protein
VHRRLDRGTHSPTYCRGCAGIGTSIPADRSHLYRWMVSPGITQQEVVIRDRRHCADKRYILWIGALGKGAIA